METLLDVYLSSPRGFCAGVVRAVDIVEIAIERFGAPVYVKHQIVHNPHVVKALEDKGAVTVEDVDDIPEGSNVVFSAHGSAPDDFEKARVRNLNIVDATCPLVTRVHNEAKKYRREGKKVILVGHRGHQEVVGTMGEAPEAMLLVESPEDVDQLQVADESKVAYLTQTTLSVDDANRIIRCLENRFPQIQAPPKADICYATQNRQETVHRLTDESDVVLVLGSQNSSNSQRLRELALERNVPAYLIDGASDIDLGWFAGDETVLVTAGASAPESVVQGCIEFLEEHFNATVELRSIREEEVHFPLPKELRSIPS